MLFKKLLHYATIIMIMHIIKGRWKGHLFTTT